MVGVMLVVTLGMGAAAALLPTRPADAAPACLLGLGTPRDPFLVATAADLAKVGSGVDGCTLGAAYRQTADITIPAPIAPATTNLTPIGSSADFTGIYDGGGFTIAGPMIVVTGQHDEAGLFAETDGAIIRDVQVVRGSVTGVSHVGGLVGWASDTLIVDSSFSGTVTGSDEDVGGLVGALSDSQVLRSFSEGTVAGVEDVGGLVGYVSGGGIRSSSSDADVTVSGSYNGGLVGYWNANKDETLRLFGTATATSAAGDDIGIGDTFTFWLTLDLDETATGSIAGGDTFNTSLDAFTLHSSHENTGGWGPDDIVWAFSPTTLLVASDTAEDRITIRVGATSGAESIDGVAFGDVELIVDWEAADLDATGTGAGIDLENFLGTDLPPLDDVDVTFRVRDANGASATFVTSLERDLPQFGTITDASARGDVTVTVAYEDEIGGFGGYVIDLRAARTFATGAVNAPVTGSYLYIGGLVGDASPATFADSFWDTETSGLTWSDRGTGRTTAQMTDIATFVAWPIVQGWAPYVATSRVWGICEWVNDGYPFLLWQYPSDPCAPPAASAAEAPSITCGPDAPRAGATIACTVSGAPADFDFLWRAAHNPVFAEGVLTTGADGTGTIAFTVPADAAGDPLTVELVAWTGPVVVGTIAEASGAAAGTAGGPVPTRVDAGRGPTAGGSPTVATFAVALLTLLTLLTAAGMPRRRLARTTPPR